jgi:SAM-dependent methyltransferase
MKFLLTSAYLVLSTVDTEAPRVLAMVRDALRGQPGPVVDVGCGYGRYLRLLAARGIDALGVEVNPAIVDKNNAAGLRCVTPERFEASGTRARVLLMAHVIEHFAPRDLLAFLDRWLERLEPGGELVIATPLESPHFYDDFDHVKPYHPEGLQMVFSGGSAQVQYWSKHRLELVDIVFRRSPWRATLARPLYKGGPGAWPHYAANALAALAFRLSGGILGRKTGWIGRFRKL